MLSSSSFSADIHIVHVGRILILRSNRNRGGDGGLGNLLNFYRPLKFRLLQIAQPVFRLPIRDDNEHATLVEDSVHFRDRFACIHSGILPALHQNNTYQDGVKGGFIDNSIELPLIEIHDADIHLEVLEHVCPVLVLLHHGLGAEGRDVDVSEVRVALVCHFLAQAGIPSPHI